MSNIVETATNAGSFKTLVAAVQAAGLGATLSGPGPFTVFAPTDQAFADLPAGTVQGLLNDIPKLTNILTFHVVPGKLMAADVVKLTSAKTVQGQNVTITSTDGVTINGAKVVTPNVEADNGVIHVIDRVILPL
ncbi:MAG: fasciclin domain-containing protein [Vicinamibacterales bacterium]